MMKYDQEFIKGVTYGEAEELWDTARNAGFIAFLGEFHKLADGYAAAQLEEFIDDHFPEDKVELGPRAKVERGPGLHEFLNPEACTFDRTIDELIAKVRRHRED